MQYFSYKFTFPLTLSIRINFQYHTIPFKLVHSLLFSHQYRMFLSAQPYNILRLIPYFDPNYHTFLLTLSTRLTFYTTTIHSLLYSMLHITFHTITLCLPLHHTFPFTLPPHILHCTVPVHVTARSSTHPVTLIHLPTPSQTLPFPATLLL